MDGDIRTKKIVERIRRIEDGIAKAKEYLATGRHAHWSGFQPSFRNKLRGGKVVPPHRDWVKNVYLRNAEKALGRTEKLLDELENRK